MFLETLSTVKRLELEKTARAKAMKAPLYHGHRETT